MGYFVFILHAAGWPYYGEVQSTCVAFCVNHWLSYIAAAMCACDEDLLVCLIFHFSYYARSRVF